MSKIRPMYVIERATTKESKGLCRKTPYARHYVTRYYFPESILYPNRIL